MRFRNALIDPHNVTHYAACMIKYRANTTDMQRKPTHPGKMLREDFLPDYGLTVSKLAELLGVSHQSINELLRECRAVSPEWPCDWLVCSATRRNSG